MKYEDIKRDFLFEQIENYDYVSLTETVCDSVQTYYDLTGFDYIAWNEMEDDEKATYIRLTKWILDNEVDYYEFHDEWVNSMRSHKWKYFDDEEYNKYRKWDYRLTSIDNLNYEGKSFSRLYVSLVYALKELFQEY